MGRNKNHNFKDWEGRWQNRFGGNKYNNPFEQPLNPDEARVLDIGESLSALQNYDLPTLPAMKPAAIEESLQNLLTAVRSGKYKLSNTF